MTGTSTTNRLPAEEVEKIFAKKVAGESLAAEEQKALEDHLFWYAVRKATECGLPVKLHTGYYVGRKLHAARPVEAKCTVGM